MVQIDIHIPRPWLTLSLAAGIAAYLMGGFDDLLPPRLTSASIGGTAEAHAAPEMQVAVAEQQILEERARQDVLAKRESILRGDMDALEMEIARTNDPQVLTQLMETRNSLIMLIEDKQRGEQVILSALHDLWEAQEQASIASTLHGGTLDIPTFMWPAEPTIGVSAHFDDDAYERRFGMPHHAVDIPILQGTTVYAAADGVITSVSDKGMGFNSVVVQHSGGYATMYGHVSAFLAVEGQAVRAGQAIALSGGMPGTPGAGSMTTGAHLHFELHKDGQQIDPLSLLPYDERVN